MGGNISINGYTASPISSSKENIEAIDLALRNLFFTYSKVRLGTLADKIYYSGSTYDYMTIDSSIFRGTIGDVDLQIYYQHLDTLEYFLTTIRDDFVSYKVVGTKRHGNELSALMVNSNKDYHQFDFQGVKGPGSEYSLFLHSSDWMDRLEGIKGAHHKILLNAVGLDDYKFSITHGCRSRTDENDPGSTSIEDVAERLFGIRTNDIWSFINVLDIIKQTKSPQEQKLIKEKFIDSVSKLKHLDSTRALDYLEKNL